MFTLLALLALLALTTQDLIPGGGVGFAPVQKLVPGPGWSGPTIPGTHPGAHENAVAIAHWTRMPEQVLWRGDAEPFRLGVLAYHRSEIASVRFAVDGGSWVRVEALTVSDQTDYYEYGVLLDPSAFAHGWHEVRAVAIPRSGVAAGGVERVLAWRFFDGAGDRAGLDYAERWVDPVGGSDGNSGTLGAPFATVKRAVDALALDPIGPEGAFVYLMGDPTVTIDVGGTTIRIANELPLVIANAPGHTPVFAPNSGTTTDELAVQRLQLEGLTVDLSWDEMFRTGVEEFEASLYVRGCHFEGITQPLNTTTNAEATLWRLIDADDYAHDGNAYAVSSTFEDIDGPPVTGFYWLRDVTVRKVRHRGMLGVRCAIDCLVETVKAGQAGGGAEGWTAFYPYPGFTPPFANGLVDGCKMLDVASGAGSLGQIASDGVALVNSVMRGGAGGGTGTFLFGYVKVSPYQRHVLILGCTFPDSLFFFNYPRGIFGPSDAFRDGLIRGVIARNFYDDEVGSGGINTNNVASSDIAGLWLDPTYVHTHIGAPPAWSSWTQGGAPQTYVDAPANYEIRPTSSAWGRMPADLAGNPFDRLLFRRGALTGNTSIGARIGTGE